MHGQSKPLARINSYHNSKRHLLGNQTGQAAPAWRDQKPKDQGSKILLSRLPPDVGETEVEELFKKTVGPLKEAFLIYNSQGRSKGMAVVVFQRAGDAAVARTKYDGKFIDGRRPIKIEIVVDSNNAVPTAPSSQTQPSLLNRLGNIVTVNAPPVISAPDHAPNGISAAKAQHAPRIAQNAPTAVVPRRRQKKGPRRVKKSIAQLDQEMEDYRSGADAFALNGK
ncbi:hypothetical protein HYDPIDRAFT_100831 [Hydnomerulius pinastri MD-312]|uniref:RRM domain-containing protein n=1 Tax=Hydnomerulius pinastri MD-312 TaxID=994086 RepID=A0A0C9W8K9_9AGAM|nr:hypothetical protein HYDPIDRAFT_100831 [Hydnomerulius pinastri MD-312]